VYDCILVNMYTFYHQQNTDIYHRQIL